MSDSLFDTGIRPAVDDFLLSKAAEKRDYGEYWSASSAGYCMRRVIFDRLRVPEVKENARKQRVFEVGHIFHEWMQRITKEAGLSIAQELELQDEGLMVRGHIDDLVLVKTEFEPMSGDGEDEAIVDSHLVLYDYKTQNSRAFSYQKGQPIGYYHKMQLGTYMYMLRRGSVGIEPNGHTTGYNNGQRTGEPNFFAYPQLVEARILKISKDDLRMTEQQLMWSLELESDVAKYWGILNGHWEGKTLPKCTCADHDGGFLAREAYNPYFFEGEPCSIAWAKSKVDLTGWSY